MAFGAVPCDLDATPGDHCASVRHPACRSCAVDHRRDEPDGAGLSGGAGTVRDQRPDAQHNDGGQRRGGGRVRDRPDGGSPRCVRTDVGSSARTVAQRRPPSRGARRTARVPVGGSPERQPRRCCRRHRWHARGGAARIAPPRMEPGAPVSLAAIGMHMTAAPAACWPPAPPASRPSRAWPPPRLRRTAGIGGALAANVWAAVLDAKVRLVTSRVWGSASGGRYGPGGEHLRVNYVAVAGQPPDQRPCDERARDYPWCSAPRCGVASCRYGHRSSRAPARLSSAHASSESHLPTRVPMRSEPAVQPQSPLASAVSVGRGCRGPGSQPEDALRPGSTGRSARLVGSTGVKESGSRARQRVRRAVRQGLQERRMPCAQRGRRTAEQTTRTRGREMP